MTQEEFGKLIGLAKENVSKIENDNYNVTKRILLKNGSIRERGIIVDVIETLMSDNQLWFQEKNKSTSI